MGTFPYTGPESAPTYLGTTANSPLGPQGPKYPFPEFSAFLCRRRYWKQVSCKDTILSIVGLQLEWVLGVGILVLLSTQTAIVTQGYLRATMGYMEGSDWW